jgi:hypothetical protein
MVRRQRGATLLGMAIIIAILGLGLYGAIRLTPLYLEYMAVVRAMEQTAKESTGDSVSPQSLRNALERRWTIEDIASIEPRDIEIKRVGSGYTMRAAYDAPAPFIGNISLVAHFDKTVDVK